MEYNIRLEYDLEPNEASGALLMEAFSAFHPGVGPSDSNNGKTDVWITLDVDNARQAAELGLALHTKAGATLTAFEVITTEDFDQRELNPLIPDLVDSTQASDMLGISRQAVLKQEAKLGGIRVGERTVLFPRRTVELAALRRNGGRFELTDETDSSAFIREKFFDRVVATLQRKPDGTWETRPQHFWMEAGRIAQFERQPTADAAYDAFVAWGGDHIKA